MKTVRLPTPPLMANTVNGERFREKPRALTESTVNGETYREPSPITMRSAANGVEFVLPPGQMK